MIEPKREVHGDGTQLWACYAPPSVLCPHLPDYQDRKRIARLVADASVMPPKVTPRELELMVSIRRIEERMSRLAAALGPDQCPCCVGAAYGGTHGKYDKLERKRDRCEASKNAKRIEHANREYGAMVRDHFLLETDATVRHVFSEVVP